MKVAIITNLIPNYRRGFYERLLQESRLDFTVFCQSHLPGFNLKPIQHELECAVVEIPFWGLKREKATWQWLPIKQLWQDFDVYVFYGNPRVFSSVVWATLFKILGKPVIIWGQGHTAGASQLTERLRLGWWRIFDYILVYTDDEARFLKENGFANKTVIGINNGLDQTRIESAKSNWGLERLIKWQQQQGLSNQKILLSSARLEAKNQFDLIIQAIPQLIQRFPNLLWCVIGDGQLQYNLEQMAVDMGVNDYIRWLGAVYDEDELAPWFLSSTVLVHPGAIGLSLLHAFGYGLPVITHNNLNNQMPEIAAFEDGVNGLHFQEADVESMGKQITKLLTDESNREKLGQDALQVARTTYNSQVMVNRFLEIVNLGFTKNNQLEL